MARLIAKPPVEGLPLTIGSASLELVDPGHITSIAPFDGQEAAVSAALKAAHGAAFPAPNRATGREGARLVWTGWQQAFLVGPVPVEIAGAAMTDQSDAWVVLRLSGDDAEAVLARLVPIDVRESAFRRGHTARTMLNHMTVSVTRVGVRSFQVMAFRSMAGTATHELATAMRSVAAQG